MKAANRPTYISLFSGAGIGCYGFQQEQFDCVATNELIARRLEIQRFNHKCKYDSGYICGDIADDSVKNALYQEIEFWKKYEGISRIDVVIATPPCQGMSVANHKKRTTEIVRNSLIVESLEIVKKVHPRFFLLENVPSFMKTACTDIHGETKTIAAAIEQELGQAYSYMSRVINFKNYGACSSRQRTVVIGVSKDYADEISPMELYPEPTEEHTLREVIGHLKPLKNFGEIDGQDIYHSFRMYPEYMRAWISETREGQSAFDNAEDSKKPHRVINGKIVPNQRKNADKYTRQRWDKVGPCIHTRNDQLASQNTIHPCDDRVFSIREIMLMMTVPPSFRWTDTDPAVLNAQPEEQKRAFLKKEEMKIRQSLGEAVPTAIFQTIAKKITEALKHEPLQTAAIHKLVSKYQLSEVHCLRQFITENSMGLSAAALGKIAEAANTNRTDHAAFFTSKSLITEMMKALPDTDKEAVHILEPSVGVGNFLPLLIRKFEGKRIFLDVVDIDANSLELAKIILKNYSVPPTCTIRYIHDDFLLHDFECRYDYVIGNPPFFKMKSSDERLAVYRRSAVNKTTTNICSFFLDKALKICDYAALVFPKFLLNTPEFAPTRKYLSHKAVECIIDFGEKGFPGVLVETLAIFVRTVGQPVTTKVISVTHGKCLSQPSAYIFDKRLPYWVIYRNAQFDAVCKKLDLNVFCVFRDRQITNAQLSRSGTVRVLRSRNISDDGKEILNIPGYDAYIEDDTLKPLAVSEYLERDDVYLTPNMTYKPRMMKKPKHCVANGSLAILIPKGNAVPTEKQLSFFSTPEYRAFYQIARNYQTRSLNVDACSVFFFGLLREKEKRHPITEVLEE